MLESGSSGSVRGVLSNEHPYREPRPEAAVLSRIQHLMRNLYSITTNQAAIIALFRVVNRYVGNLPPMTGVFPDYSAPVVRNTDTGRELSMMRWAYAATAAHGRTASHEHP
jgi:hypothetical protein